MIRRLDPGRLDPRRVIPRRLRRPRVVTGAILAAPLALTVGFAVPARAQESLTVRVTLYGFPDNSPPGRTIDCGQIHNQAGGTGTFDDPVTFATGHDQDDVLPCGTVIYVPFMK